MRARVSGRGPRRSRASRRQGPGQQCSAPWSSAWLGPASRTSSTCSSPNALKVVNPPRNPVTPSNHAWLSRDAPTRAPTRPITKQPITLTQSAPRRTGVAGHRRAAHCPTPCRTIAPSAPPKPTASHCMTPSLREVRRAALCNFPSSDDALRRTRIFHGPARFGLCRTEALMRIVNLALVLCLLTVANARPPWDAAQTTQQLEHVK